MEKENTRKQAVAICAKVEGVKLDSPALIGIVLAVLPSLLKLFTGCLAANETSSGLASYVAEHYDAGTGEYDRSLLRTTRHEVEHEARHQRQKMSRDEAKQVAWATLEHARLSSADDIVGCMKEI